jgi:cell division protein FtsX
LKNIPGIKEVSFISKEAAKQKYMDEDWDKVLDSNPLPNSIEVKLDAREWTGESLNKLKKIDIRPGIQSL